MASTALGCAKVCLGLSVSGIILLSVWGVLLVTHSLTFVEVPDAKKTRGGVGCFIAAALYVVTAAASAFVLAKYKDGSPSAREFGLLHKYTRMSEFGRDHDNDNDTSHHAARRHHHPTFSRPNSVSSSASNRQVVTSELSRRSPPSRSSAALQSDVDISPLSDPYSSLTTHKNNKPSARVKGQPYLTSRGSSSPKSMSITHQDLLSDESPLTEAKIDKAKDDERYVDFL